MNIKMHANLPKLWLTSCLLISNLVLIDLARSQESVEYKVDGEAATPIVVTLLGTAAPTLDPEQSGSSTLITIGKTQLLFDAGRSVVQQLSKLNPGNERKSIAGINHVFLTHLHFDHIISLDDFWLSRWMNSRKREPLQLWGPEGTDASINHMIGTYEVDVADRFARSESLGIRGANNPRIKILTTEILKDGVVFAENGITVTAFAVEHGMLAYGYRIDYDGKSVVLSGDTAPTPNLIKNSQNVDLLVHEVFSFSPSQKNNPVLPVVLNAHTSPEQAAEVFNLTKPKLAVYNHIGNFPGPESGVDYVGRTTKYYDGKVVLGEDLMTITIGDEVKVSD